MKIDNEVGVLAALDDTGYPAPDTLRPSGNNPFSDRNCIWVFSFNFRSQMPQVMSGMSSSSHGVSSQTRQLYIISA